MYISIPGLPAVTPHKNSHNLATHCETKAQRTINELYQKKKIQKIKDKRQQQQLRNVKQTLQQ